MMMTAVMLIAAAVCLEPVQISMSSRDEPIVATITSTTPQGIHVQLDDQRAYIVPWYELRAGLVPDGVQPGFEEIASQAWRAHERLSRGDIHGALPLYQSLSRSYLWKQGPQSQDVSHGLSRCLIAIGQRRRAIEPMLASLDADGAAVTGSGARSEMIDPDLNLRRDLPPVFAQADSSPLTDSVDASERLMLMHSYYALVAAPPSEQEQWLASIAQLKRSLGSRDAGLVLIEQVSFAQAHSDGPTRRAALAALQRRTKTQEGTWIEVWARLGLGVSQLYSADELVRDKGLLELIHIIVRLGEVEPGLTLFAAEIAREYLSRTDRAAWGSILMHEAQNNIQSGHARTIGTGDPAP
jgi:hypothetical protein